MWLIVHSVTTLNSLSSFCRFLLLFRQFRVFLWCWRRHFSRCTISLEFLWVLWTVALNNSKRYTEVYTHRILCMESLHCNVHFSRWPELANFTGAKDIGSGSDNWSYKTWKAPVNLSSTNQHSTSYRLYALPVVQPTVSKALKEKYFIWTNIESIHIKKLKRCYYCPHPNSGGIKWWCASDVCLLHTSGLSREQKGPGRLKLAQR